MAVGDLKTDQGVKDLNIYLAERSYIEGWVYFDCLSTICDTRALHVGTLYLPNYRILSVFPFLADFPKKSAKSNLFFVISQLSHNLSADLNHPSKKFLSRSNFLVTNP